MKKIVYHGGRFGKDTAWFSDNPKVAGGFGKITHSPMGVPQYNDYKIYEIEYSKPFIMDAKGENWYNLKTPKKLKPYWSSSTIDSNGIIDICNELGYDCIIIKNIEEGTTSIVATDYCLLNGKYKEVKTTNKLVKLAEDLDYYADLIEAEIEEMSVKTSFDFKPIYMDRKSQELYSNYFVDFITPNFFAVMKETKYRDEDSADKFKCSIEFQKGAMSIRDYNPRKAEVFRGMQRTLADMRSANKWLANQIKENFGFVLKGGLSFG